MKKLLRIFWLVLIPIGVILLFFTSSYTLKYIHWQTKSHGYPELYNIENQYSFDQLDNRLLELKGWSRIEEDKKGDGDIMNWPDAKELYALIYNDTIWFRYILHNNININEPMVSIALGNSTSEKKWYGSVANYKYSEMISVGYVRKGDKYFGYNLSRDKNGICMLKYDLKSNSLILAVPKKELQTYESIVASVGCKGLWNDDFDGIINIRNLKRNDN